MKSRRRDDDEAQAPRAPVADILRRRGVWGGLAFLVVIAPTASLITFLPDIYRSAATVLIERQQIPDDLVKSTVTSALEVRLQTISQEILSRSRLEEMIARFGLYQDDKKAPTEQIIDPKEYRYHFDNPGYPRFSLGALNVRLFNIQGAPDDRVMDTLGLAALGLPDLQCHFRDLECNDVASLLRNLGLYLFEHGDIIEDGHTVSGIPATEKWRCQHEMALIGPERIVLDIDPGPAFAAGNRRQHE